MTAPASHSIFNYIMNTRSTFARARNASCVAPVAVALLLGAGAALLGACGGEAGDDRAREHAVDTAVTAAPDSGHGAMGQGGHASATPALATRLEFSAAGGQVVAGKPQEWTLRILDVATGAPVGKFEVEHEKLIHLIVVSRDLAWFNHIHPEYKGNGEFRVTTALPRSGSYRLYADVVAAGHGKQVLQYDLTTSGGAPTAAASLRPDTVGAGGWMVTKVAAKPEGEPDQAGGPVYEVAFMPMNLAPGQDGMLHFQVRDAAGKPITDLQPYLGAMGHAVILSEDGARYLHSHPMDGGMSHGGGHDAHGGMDHGDMDHGDKEHGDMGHGGTEHMHAPARSGGPDVMFHTNIPAPGRYKVWGQFQHKGKIITASFVVDVPA